MTDKTWRYIAIAYAVVCALALLIESRVSHLEPMASPMDKILLAPILWGFAAYGVWSGYVRGRFSRVERSESPITFWVNIAFLVLFGLIMFCWGVRDAFQ